MLLELTTTQRPATDLGFLLHKNPARAQSFDLAFGRVHVFYPEESCVLALLCGPLSAPLACASRVGNRQWGKQPQLLPRRQLTHPRPWAGADAADRLRHRPGSRRR